MQMETNMTEIGTKERNMVLVSMNTAMELFIKAILMTV